MLTRKTVAERLISSLAVLIILLALPAAGIFAFTSILVMGGLTEDLLVLLFRISTNVEPTYVIFKEPSLRHEGFVKLLSLPSLWSWLALALVGLALAWKRIGGAAPRKEPTR